MFKKSIASVVSAALLVAGPGHMTLTASAQAVSRGAATGVTVTPAIGASLNSPAPAMSPLYMPGLAPSAPTSPARLAAPSAAIAAPAVVSPALATPLLPAAAKGAPLAVIESRDPAVGVSEKAAALDEAFDNSVRSGAETLEVLGQSDTVETGLGRSAISRMTIARISSGKDWIFYDDARRRYDGSTVRKLLAAIAGKDLVKSSLLLKDRRNCTLIQLDLKGRYAVDRKMQGEPSYAHDPKVVARIRRPGDSDWRTAEMGESGRAAAKLLLVGKAEALERAGAWRGARQVRDYLGALAAAPTPASPEQVLVGLSPYDFQGADPRRTRLQVRSFMSREFPDYPAIPRSYRSDAYQWISVVMDRGNEGLLKRLADDPAVDNVEGRFKGGYGVWFKRRMTRGQIESMLKPYDGKILVSWDNSPHLSLRVRVPGSEARAAEMKFRSYREIVYSEPALEKGAAAGSLSDVTNLIQRAWNAILGLFGIAVKNMETPAVMAQRIIDQLNAAKPVYNRKVQEASTLVEKLKLQVEGETAKVAELERGITALLSDSDPANDVMAAGMINQQKTLNGSIAATNEQIGLAEKTLAGIKEERARFFSEREETIAKIQSGLTKAAAADIQKQIAELKGGFQVGDLKDNMDKFEAAVNDKIADAKGAVDSVESNPDQILKKAKDSLKNQEVADEIAKRKAAIEQAKKDKGQAAGKLGARDLVFFSVMGGLLGLAVAALPGFWPVALAAGLAAFTVLLPSRNLAGTGRAHDLAAVEHRAVAVGMGLHALHALAIGAAFIPALIGALVAAAAYYWHARQDAAKAVDDDFKPYPLVFKDVARTHIEGLMYETLPSQSHAGETVAAAKARLQDRIEKNLSWDLILLNDVQDPVERATYKLVHARFFPVLRSAVENAQGEDAQAYAQAVRRALDAISAAVQRGATIDGIMDEIAKSKAAIEQAKKDKGQAAGLIMEVGIAAGAIAALATVSAPFRNLLARAWNALLGIFGMGVKKLETPAVMAQRIIDQLNAAKPVYNRKVQEASTLVEKLKLQIEKQEAQSAELDRSVTAILSDSDPLNDVMAESLLNQKKTVDASTAMTKEQLAISEKTLVDIKEERARFFSEREETIAKIQAGLTKAAAADIQKQIAELKGGFQVGDLKDNMDKFEDAVNDKVADAKGAADSAESNPDQILKKAKDSLKDQEVLDEIAKRKAAIEQAKKDKGQAGGAVSTAQALGYFAKVIGIGFALISPLLSALVYAAMGGVAIVMAPERGRWLGRQLAVIGLGTLAVGAAGAFLGAKLGLAIGAFGVGIGFVVPAGIALAAGVIATIRAQKKDGATVASAASTPAGSSVMTPVPVAAPAVDAPSAPTATSPKTSFSIRPLFDLIARAWNALLGLFGMGVKRMETPEILAQRLIDQLNAAKPVYNEKVRQASTLVEKLKLQIASEEAKVADFEATISAILADSNPANDIQAAGLINSRKTLSASIAASRDQLVSSEKALENIKQERSNFFAEREETLAKIQAGLTKSKSAEIQKQIAELKGGFQIGDLKDNLDRFDGAVNDKIAGAKGAADSVESNPDRILKKAKDSLKSREVQDELARRKAAIEQAKKDKGRAGAMAGKPFNPAATIMAAVLGIAAGIFSAGAALNTAGGILVLPAALLVGYGLAQFGFRAGLRIGHLTGVDSLTFGLGLILALGGFVGGLALTGYLLSGGIPMVVAVNAMGALGAWSGYVFTKTSSDPFWGVPEAAQAAQAPRRRLGRALMELGKFEQNPIDGKRFYIASDDDLSVRDAQGKVIGWSKLKKLIDVFALKPNLISPKPILQSGEIFGATVAVELKPVLSTGKPFRVSLREATPYDKWVRNEPYENWQKALDMDYQELARFVETMAGAASLDDIAEFHGYKAGKAAIEAARKDKGQAGGSLAGAGDFTPVGMAVMGEIKALEEMGEAIFRERGISQNSLTPALFIETMREALGRYSRKIPAGPRAKMHSAAVSVQEQFLRVYEAGSFKAANWAAFEAKITPWIVELGEAVLTAPSFETAPSRATEIADRAVLGLRPAPRPVR